MLNPTQLYVFRKRNQFPPSHSWMNPRVLSFTDAGYPVRVRDRLGKDSPRTLTSLGNLELLLQPKTAVFCSVRCPGNAILSAYDTARELRDEGVTVVSGFHSPVEKELPPHSTARKAVYHNLSGALSGQDSDPGRMATGPWTPIAYWCSRHSRGVRGGPTQNLPDGGTKSSPPWLTRFLSSTLNQAVASREFRH